VGRGERLGKLGHSWFSAKSINVKPRTYHHGGRALIGCGSVFPDTNPSETPNTVVMSSGSQSLGAKVQGREGNSPDRPPRSYRADLSEKGCFRAVTALRWAWKQPSWGERVTAQGPSGAKTPKM